MRVVISRTDMFAIYINGDMRPWDRWEGGEAISGSEWKQVTLSRVHDAKNPKARPELMWRAGSKIRIDRVALGADKQPLGREWWWCKLERVALPVYDAADDSIAYERAILSVERVEVAPTHE